MSAPLYSRYRRYADREAARFPRTSLIARTIPIWKRPDTRVYSLTDRASHEAGWWSGEPPGELLRAMSLHYLPMPQVWIELDWVAYNKGTNRRPLEDTRAPRVLDHDGNSVGLSGPDSPVRMGIMLQEKEYDRASGKNAIAGLLFYLYPTGTCFVGPVIFAWDSDLKDEGESARASETVALGRTYIEKHGKDHPVLMKRLQRRAIISGLDKNTTLNFSEIEGTTRMAIAALTAVLAARPPVYAPNPNGAVRERPVKHGAERDRPIEVDLFIRERPRVSGGSIRASVGHLEAVKKGRHTVAAHYAYRARADGGDPTACPKTPQHDFENIDGSKSQVCIYCGQKRWFKERHERGDEAYGIVPAKTYNVRVGTPRASELTNTSGDY